MRSTGRFFLSSGGAFVETRFPSYRGLYVTLAHSCSSLPPAVHAANTVSYRRTRAAWPTDENCKIASRTIQRVRLAAGIREQKGNCRDAERRRGRWWPPVLRAGALRMLGYEKVRYFGLQIRRCSSEQGVQSERDLIANVLRICHNFIGLITC